LIGSCASVDNYSHWSRFNGLVDDLLLYKIALTEDEIQDLYKETSTDKFFSLQLKTPLAIKPGTATTGKIVLSAEKVGKHLSSLSIVSDAKNATKLTVPLKAEVIAQPNLVVSPESLHFGLMDKQSKTEDLLLANKGTSDLKYEIYLSDQADSPKAKTALFATGYNYSGQLGDGSTTNRKVPIEILANAKKSYFRI
jgi:hypothetical protein